MAAERYQAAKFLTISITFSGSNVYNVIAAVIRKSVKTLFNYQGLFYEVEWQSPAALMHEWDADGEICRNRFLLYEVHKCPLTKWSTNCRMIIGLQSVE